MIGTQQIGGLEDAAYIALALIIVGLMLAATGATLLVRKSSSPRIESHRFGGFPRLSSIMADRRSARVFAISAISYGVFFAIASSTLVFQPGLIFSDTYGVQVPSLVPVVCCGAFGQMPQLVVYVTQQLAVLVVPENLILLVIVSWLVGLNASIAYFAYASRSRDSGARWIGGFGAMLGLFTICPPCAGYFLLAALGLTGAVGLTVTLSSLQALFIGAGIPILAITPILATKRVLVAKECVIAPQNRDVT